MDEKKNRLGDEITMDKEKYLDSLQDKLMKDLIFLTEEEEKGHFDHDYVLTMSRILMDGYFMRIRKTYEMED